jgi:lysozyme family protein
MIFETVALPLILKNEGVRYDKVGKIIDTGYVNNSNDAGGETNFGITQKTYDLTKVKKIKDITYPEVVKIYNQSYWLAASCDRIANVSPALAIAVFDIAVNCGTSTAIRLLQEALFTKVDSIFGPSTLAALKSSNDLAALGSLSVKRQRYYAHLAQVYPHNLPFLVGWIIRTVNVYNVCVSYYLNNPILAPAA